MKKIWGLLAILVFMLSCQIFPGTKEKETQEVDNSILMPVAGETITIPPSESVDIEISQTDKRFFGTWSVLDVSVGNYKDIIPFVTNEIIFFRDDLRYHELGVSAYDPNYSGVLSYYIVDAFGGRNITWKSDDSFLYLYLEQKENFKIKYAFLDDYTLTLTLKDGTQLTYGKIDEETRTPIQKAMIGTWECPYNAEYGEKNIAIIQCDDGGVCLGQPGIKTSDSFPSYDGNRYKLSTIYYRATNYYVEDIQSQISNYSQVSTEKFIMFDYPLSLDQKLSGCKIPEYTFSNDFSEFSAIGECGNPDNAGSAAWHGYYLSCRKISE